MYFEYFKFHFICYSIPYSSYLSVHPEEGNEDLLVC